MLQSLLPGSESSDPTQQLALLFSLNAPISASSLLPSVLMAAPHLAKLSSLGADAHLDSTWKLRQAYSGNKAIDTIVDIMQHQKLDELILHSI